MALIECKECGGKVSSEAEKCPHCGITLINKTPKKKSNNGCFWTVVVGLCFILFLYILGSGGSDDSSSDYEVSHPNKFLAYNYAEDAVEKNLKSPSTAEFPGATEKNSHIQYLGNGEYKINSWVDSQNGFGAMIRSNFSIEIIFKGDNVSYRNLKIE